MTEAHYRRALRAAVRGLWSGVLDYDQAFDSLISTIRRNLTRAAREGAAECGIRPEEFSAEERVALERYIFDQIGHVAGLLAWIEANSRARKDSKKAKLLQRQGEQTVYGRLEMWVNFYRTVRANIAAMACGDRKKVFRLGATKEHCKSCAGLNGRVYRYSVWQANNAIPPSRGFECGGYNCRCYLEDTDAPLTKGPFPGRLMVH